ncbi:hypothetical protein [Pseudomonas syringae]|uniref:Uncharacterized protein n=1 Tax=Pseudomonas syringae CC1417 TaxID=1357272 RepID=A0AAU8LB25_PSESX
MADRRPRAFIAWQLPATGLPRALVDLFSALYLNRVDLLVFVKRQKAKVNRDCESIWINDAPKGVNLVVIDAQDHEVDVRGDGEQLATDPNKYHSLPLQTEPGFSTISARSGLSVLLINVALHLNCVQDLLKLFSKWQIPYDRHDGRQCVITAAVVGRG